MRAITGVILLGVALGIPTSVLAGIDISPYYSIKSTKSVTPGNNNKTIENEKVTQRQEYGVRATISMWRLLKFQASVGQSEHTKSENVTEVADEYDEINFQEELEIDTSDPTADVTIKETQRIGKLSLVVDPSFSIFIARVKLGITARQRIIDRSQQGLPDTQVVEGPTYKPHSGIGFGVRLTSQIYWMAEYEFYHYKYPPDIEPFERELSVSFSVSI
ncbi:hypothetical protein [Pseudobacteriovorax antillogorgiicola]|uniref:Outer membrane protein beta-barrel domain-containing protein n=1 Tax=Pseudobacteriovorax antillogorgiicola TaxID=1513793 RepID=A0A1Y6C7S3_9BACT|nr:hypothetical protein [Pseudobacteriovorax antillogorgiicola]TCS51717.1 hypothetical protein EDD56_110102 [Pseudobacteriovorax antillogorgiicola]SMF49394.1 hypothetical protein SAMN06296036_11571 [Pseudobacteriovorax antillogorgiicola]